MLDKEMLERLENPIWAALNSAQAELAHKAGDMKFFAAEVAPFCAVPRDGMPLPATDLEYLPPQVYFLGAIPQVPPEWTMTQLSGVVQMVYDGPKVEKPRADGVTVLDSEDPAMVELTDVAFPGYFRRRTGILGTYLGIHQDGKLVALSGERMHLGDCREVSAVCTHPDYRGRGYANLLMQHIMYGMQEQGKTPFLHVGAANAKAQALYQALGFKVTRELPHTRLVRPAGL
ncbi:GNAT family N-acetyltransferase [Massilia endophytica]|uniref:GNAT family N-acetyltransferase n=1 Tax=Massilia endophytica TaxID=2899220 RepID=UPI001E56F761|nr:GNAT family N-acetyltransferase [Massilia endophytica]UGQ47916.1 GNAT family N-acetyltransferase [Massilia endophytica]